MLVFIKPQPLQCLWTSGLRICILIRIRVEADLLSLSRGVAQAVLWTCTTPVILLLGITHHICMYTDNIVGTPPKQPHEFLPLSTEAGGQDVNFLWTPSPKLIALVQRRYLE